MKRIVTMIICIFILSISVLTITAEEEPALLTVEVHADGSFTVTTAILPEKEWATREYNSVFIYTKEALENHNQNGVPIETLLWWVPAADRVTIVQYPGRKGIRYPTRDAQAFIDGPGSALRPGKYFADLIGYDGMIAGPVAFEIPEITVTPTPLPTASPTPTSAPTASPTVKATAPKTAAITATPAP